jgi:glycosyltransferase involved in cell wall biosynthesis
MKVFLSPSIALHSPAMVRIENALIRYLPDDYTVVSEREEADLCIFYPISYEWKHYIDECRKRGQKYALIQCCYKTSGASFDEWKSLWDDAVVVWSYLDLLEGRNDPSIPFYHAPLGVDEAFLNPVVTHPKRDYIVTTGTVHGEGAEAIKECWQAAFKCGLGVVHVGPWPENVSNSKYDFEEENLQTITNCTDQTLRGIYQNALYTCSLRYVEGFELPALESLSCGTRAIVFTQPAMTKWYYRFADFVPESGSSELVKHLVSKFSHYEPLSQSLIDEVRSRFDWRIICERFWQIVQMEIKR